jgi:hypothetical protein
VINPPFLYLVVTFLPVVQKHLFWEIVLGALFQNPVMPVIILDVDFTDLRICCLKFASIGVNRILKITGK